MAHEVLSAGKVAVITGAASGIGFAAAQRFRSMGMRVALVDLPGEALTDAEAKLGGADDVIAVAADVSDDAALRKMQAEVTARFGSIDLLMNNAGIGPGTDVFGSDANWAAIIDTNLLGVVRGSQFIVPGMIDSGRPGLVIKTGSKQGITTPPGNPAYNVAKAGVKAFTEALQHHLRNIPGCRVTAHLLIPGFVFTGITARHHEGKPAAAWTPEQTVDFMIDALGRDDFYILCPDNDVDRALDERRILWAAGDIVENRPPLSRWHPDYKEAFRRFASQS